MKRGILAVLLAAGSTAAITMMVVLLPTDDAQAQASRDEQATADTALARVQSFDITTTATGDLQARKQVEIRSQLESQSTIVEIVPEGAIVRQGDVLVRLKSDQIQTQIEEEVLRVESARAELVAAENSYEIQVSQNESTIRDSQLKLDLARLALDQWSKGDVEKQRQQLELSLEKAERDLNRLVEKFERSEELYEQGFLSKNERDLDEIAKIEAEANVRKAKLEQEIYWTYTHPKDQRTRQSDVEQAAAELERVQRQNEIQLTSKDADRLNKRRQKTVREARLAKLEQQLAACEIKAPSGGLVVYATSVERNRWGGSGDGPLQIGREVFPNMLLIVLPDTSAMVATVRVHESLAGRMRQGQRASIRIDAHGGRTIGGTVDSVGVMAESGGWRDPNLREYTVRVALDDSDLISELKPAMRCEATITMGRVEDALTIPLQAVFNDGAVRFVYTPRGTKYVRMPVSVGRRSDTHAEITVGLESGTRVLVREPSPGEVLSSPWDEQQLTNAGYTKTANGEIIPTALARAIEAGGMPGAAPGANPGAGGAPQRVPGGARPTSGESRPRREGGSGGPAASAPASTEKVIESAKAAE
ncbi:efflux RND transporter periplasmic adaptor subunit [Nodularia spumigena]|uniref:efflux RND transporter periplasmic adaptor subunit n=1 Tax=Nodularia spumigena TaxID=70799 RepID=UPI002B21E845|nr:HlyD family efflux transporter periplasmic adaptor subunit [Nodularia spumigena]MEA5557666.1 HlyD family efflux transporter periplasmic adaptor subunit [Nodularia spumigena CH309]